MLNQNDGWLTVMRSSGELLPAVWAAAYPGTLASYPPRNGRILFRYTLALSERTSSIMAYCVENRFHCLLNHSMYYKQRFVYCYMFGLTPSLGDDF